MSDDQVTSKQKEIFVCENQQTNRCDLMKKARGIWANREDLNSIENLRKEWERFL